MQNPLSNPENFMTSGFKKYILTQTAHIFGLAVIIFQAVLFLWSLAPGYGSKELLTLPEKPLYPPPKACQLSFFPLLKT